MNIVMRNLRFVNYDPDNDSTIDIRPMTKQEIEKFWDFFAERSGDDFCDGVADFAAEFTDGAANEIEWDLAFEETG